MHRIAGAVLVLLMTMPALRAEDKPKSKPATPAEQYKALVKEYQDAQQAFQKAYQEAKTKEDQQKVIQEKYPQPDKFAPKFLELAEKHAKDVVAVDALVWVVTNSFNRGAKDNPRTKALAILKRDHIQNSKLGPICQSLIYGFDKQAEALLGALLEKNPHKDVQGQACLALGQYLKNRNEMVRMLKDRPDAAKYYEGALGKDYLKELQARDPDKAAKEAEELFERAAAKYADIKMQFYGTVGAKAKAELFEIRHLAVGKVAPDIEGQDQDGKTFKLSDYRGKVVLLDFWSQF